MKTHTAMDQVRRDLLVALDHTRADLDRVELLSAAMSAFSKPVPEYEPRFHHMHELALTKHEIH